MAQSENTRIIVVGAGIGGMCTAVALATSRKIYDITVLEQVPVISELGAGVQHHLDMYAVKPGYNKFLRWEDGRELCKVPTNVQGRFEEKYGYPFYQVYRADLINGLVERAQQLGVSVRTNSAVISFEAATDASSHTVCLASGEKLSADIVVGADGGRSTISPFIVGHPSPAKNTGDSAYRALLPVNLLGESEISLFKENGQGSSNIWVGPDSHVVSYLVRNMEYLNLVVLVPDSIEPGAEENWKQKGDIRKLRDFFKDWDPRLRKLLDRIDESYLWRLRDRPVLEQWVHDSANLVLLGDSAHPMLPYAASGAACCGEDAATLAACLERVTTDAKFSVRDALKAYEALRVKRASQMVEQSRSNRGMFHMHDGPGQQARDAGIADPEKVAAMMAGLHGFDAIGEVNRYFEEKQ